MNDLRPSADQLLRRAPHRLWRRICRFTLATWVMAGNCLVQAQSIETQASQSSGQDTTIEFVAPWPPWVTILIVIGAGVFTYGIYFREQIAHRNWVKFGLATLRFALICLVIWMMYGYTLRPFRTDLPDLLLILDSSKSMTTVDSIDDEVLQARISESLDKLELDINSRLNQAKAIVLRDDARLLRFLQENYQLKLLSLNSTDSLEPMVSQIAELTAKSEQSRLGAVLRRTLQRQRGRPVAAVIYLTDGVTTDGPPLSEVAMEAKQRDIPLHIVGLGSELPAKDVRLSDLLVDEVVFVGDLVTFDLTLSADGYENETTEVTVQRADGTGEPTSQQIQLDADSDSQSVRLALEAEEQGIFEFVVETPAKPGEATTDNNALRATVEVRDEKTRVLLVQSYPSYEYHYLKTLLEREAGDQRTDGAGSVELSVLLQEADAESADVDVSAIRSFPTRDELFEFDVCIFGDVNPSFLGNDALSNLRDFVRDRGRGFIGIAGARYFPSAYVDTPLAEILPFEIRSSLTPPPDLPIESGFLPTITPLGKRMPSMQLSLNADDNDQIWSTLPELYWLLEVDTLKPGVRVLAEHPDRTNTASSPLPVITLSYVGAGKVLFQNTDDSWRWRIGHGDEYFGRYWQQSIRYLSRFKLGEGRDIELTSDRELYNRGEIVRLRARFFDERRAPDQDSGVTVVLEQQGRGQRRVTLKRDSTDRGVFTVDVANLSTGQYHGWVSEPAADGQAPSTDFQIVTLDSEMNRLEMDAVDMRRAADTSGGKYYTFSNADELTEYLPVGRQVRIEPLPPTPLWNSWKIATLFVALLVTEWVLRRKAGMV